jgi:DNA-binding GntR family transcriptional regulator
VSSVTATLVAPSSLSEKAYYAIRDMIVSLRLRPGAVVNEKALVEQLGIGRTPVREALRRLAQEQLVEVYPRRGMFVTTVEIGDLAALCEVRGVLESHAAALAAQRATDDDLGSLTVLVEGLDAGRDEQPGQRELMALDERIHRTIWAAAHNLFLEQTLDQYYVHALRIWHVALDRASELSAAVHSHRRVLVAIVRQDQVKAAELMRRHVDDFERSMRRVLVP